MSYKVGIDVGGTFTDFLLIDEEGKSEVYKVLSTWPDPSIGTVNGFQEMAKARDIKLSEFLSQVALVVHGTTITTNAVLTGKIAKTGFITVKGFRDYLNERRGMKRNLYTPKESPPPPIVPRYLIRGVEGRIDCEGKELIPLKEDDVYEAIRVFKKEKVEAVAVSLFFSFLNPSHEIKVKEILEKEMPEAYITLSHKVLPQVRIYERASTTVFNACVAPILRTYVTNLTDKLHKNGFKGILLLMQSNGGVMSPEVAMNFAVNTLLSGPAGGPVAGLFYAGIHNIDNLITTDMGGTSFDACLIRNREPEITVENEVGEYRIAVPSLAVHSIGAGGGSIAWLDGGILRVGPLSAGSSPGPACYGFGGVEPTVSDADLVLGYLNTDYFLGGRMKVYPQRAEKAIKERISQPLGLDLVRAAYGIYSVINTNMAQAIRVASVSRGYDPRACLLVVAGGAGPLHACDIAKELEMQIMLVPKFSSVFCASGMLISNLRHDFVRVYYALMKEGHVDAGTINTLLQEMKEEGIITLKKEGIAPDKIQITYSADLRYEAQMNEIEIPLSLTKGAFDITDLSRLQQAFDEKHVALYGYSLSGTTLEIICLRVKAEGVTSKPRFKEMPYMGEDASKAIKGYRQIYWNEKGMNVPIYDGPSMGHGHKFSGPAVIEEPTTNILVTTDWQATCDRYGNYLIHLKGIGLEDALNSIRR